MLKRAKLVERILQEDGKYCSEDSDVIRILLDKTVSANVHKMQSEQATFGTRMSDKLAEVAGSWPFILTMLSIILIWILFNSVAAFKIFDPYPYIFLNLVLSCIAAVQAPVIMMSQNRQEQKDRIRAENDYRVNLKSEIIIEDIHTKLEYLIKAQKKREERFPKVEDVA